ncbi:hypothetical protein V5O48_012031 [Marasmius crinis-equi]|uniref:CxC2-like cysteine cluster KDZ transposase-associated domain-containing protein n=1 Tax=Marasmius crinis-equi TaxID=585013 RepID=A0ABR3F3Y6_9AGAR
MSSKRKANIADLLQQNQAAPGPTKRVRHGTSDTTTVQGRSSTTTTRETVNSTPKIPTQGSQAEAERDARVKTETIKQEKTPDIEAGTRSNGKPPNFLAAFMGIISQLTVWLALHEWDSALNLDCDCGKGKRLVQCQDCQDFDICCSECWLEQHRYNPWHWARVWVGSFFVRSDISVLRKEGFAVQLGHHGLPCPTLDNPRPVKFTVAHSNGVHGTLLSFCNCTSASRVQQLMKSRLFPATALEPETAYTFPMMREYDILSLQGKIPAYDWIHGLRRLTDNAHTYSVNDPYNPFMLAARVWRYIHDRLRHGEFYNLNARTLPHLPSGSMVVRCPTCSDPDMNMEDRWWETTPEWLRHLVMVYTTLDGNSKTRRFRKKGGENDVSLYEGKAQFPPNDAYAKFLKKAKKSKRVEPTPDCDSVKVVTRLTDLATHGMAVTGTVNHQCSHLFIMGATDMFGSENQANVDAAFSRGYTLYGYEDKKIKQSTSHRGQVPHKQTYDAECQYAINQNLRFDEFKHLKPHHEFVTSLERGIPVVHLTGHLVILCKVLFALFYHWCNGHFTGEGAELNWPELNRVGTFTCQMLWGHRQDVLIANYNDINFKKLINQAYRLARDIVIAASQLEDNMIVFQRESAVYIDKVSEWSRQDLIPRPNPEVKGSWMSAYHRVERSKVPSIDSVLRSIAEQEGGGINLAIPGVGKDLDIYWRRAFEAEEIREKIAIFEDKTYLPEAETKTLEGLRARLELVIEAFRERQGVVTPRLPERFTVEVEDESVGFILGLPSDMTRDERVAYGAAQLATQEATLRTSHAHETINTLQSTSRKIEILMLYKDQNVSTEDMRTRFGKTMQGVLDTRSRLLSVYNHDRQALVRLNAIDEDNQEMPTLSPEDTERKDVNRKRRTGDSKHRDGQLWTVGPVSIKRLPNIPLGFGEVVKMEELVSATKITQRMVRHSRSVWDGLMQLTKKSRKANKDPTVASVPRNAKERREGKRDAHFRKERDEGVLWSLGARKGLSKCDEEAIVKFEEEGDRISWTRQQAEVFRWMEEFEKKHAEFHRTIRYFERMKEAWTKIADNPEDPINSVESIDRDPEAKAAKVFALKARARRQAAIWGDLARSALAQFRDVSYPKFFDMSKPLAPRVVDFRNEQLAWFTELKMERADLLFGATKAGMERSKIPGEKSETTKRTKEIKATKAKI